MEMTSEETKLRFKEGEVPRDFKIRKLIGKKCSECPAIFYTTKSTIMTCGPECSVLRHNRLRHERMQQQSEMIDINSGPILCYLSSQECTGIADCKECLVFQQIMMQKYGTKTGGFNDV